MSIFLYFKKLGRKVGLTRFVTWFRRVITWYRIVNILFTYRSSASKLRFGDKDVYPCDAVAIHPHYMFIHQLQAKQIHE